MKKSNIFMTMFMAIGIGYILGLLFAPEKGEVTRKQLKKDIDKFQKNLEDSIDETMDKTKKNADYFADKTERIKENIKDTLGVKKDDYLTRAKREIADILDNLEKETGHLEKKVRKVDID